MEHLSRIFAKAGLTVDNGATFNGLVNANTDTDRFLVADNGVLKFRTGAEILSDIGGASSASGLPIGGTAGQILAKIDATNYNTEWIDNFTTDVRQYVKAGEAINKGQAVYISSADGTNPIVSKASNASEATSSKTLGLLAQNLSHNGFGYVITEGRLSGLDTSSAQIADPVWLGTNGNLIFGLANKPIAPAHLVYLGVVTRVNANNGEIFVHVQNGVELNEIHDVLIQSVANKDIIYRDASTNLWKNASIATVLGFTPADNAALANYQLTSQKAQPNGYASLDGNGKVPLAQMNDSIIGQVEYMGLWNAATNTPTLSSTPQQKGHYYIVSAAGTQFGISFEIGDWIISNGTGWDKVDNTDAVNSVFGRVGNVAAAEADYQSFYPRLSQVYANPSWISELAWSKITGTPTTLAGYGITDAVPSSRTITINGTTYDLSANRTWTISEADTLATVTARGNTTSANVIIGGTTDAGFKLDVVGTFRASGDATLSSLAGSGSRMVVANSSGVLSTQAIPVGTVTSVGLTTGISGTDVNVSGSPVTGSGVITLNIPTASATNRGVLSSADWTSFNSKEPAIASGTTSQYWRGDKSWQTLNTTAVTEGTNLYYTDARARLALSSAPPISYDSGTGVISITQSSGNTNGFLSSTDWTTFNNKVGGSGTINYLSKFTASGTIGNSQLFDNGTNVEIGYGSAQGLYKLDVNGSVRVNTNLYVVDAIGIGVAPNTNRPLQILKNLNTTVGIRFENTNTGANAFSALQMGEDINATGTKFVNFLYVNSSVSRYGAYVPQGTSLINVGSGGLNLGTVGGGISFYNALLSKAGEMFSSGNWYLGTGLTPTDAGFRLDVSGTFRTSGNSVLALSSGAVLVGTSTDNLSGAKLQVSGAATFSSTITATRGIFGTTGSGTFGVHISDNDQSNVRLRLTNTGTGGQAFSLVGGNPGASNAGFAIYDETNAATRLYISSTGAATFSSSVTANANAGGTSLILNGRNNAGIDDNIISFFKNDGTTLQGRIYARSNIIGIRDANNTDVLNIVGGSVGIGTASPSTTLHVDGNSAELVRFNSTAANGSYLGFRNSSTLNGAIGTGSNLIGSITTSDLGLWTTGSIVFQANGSVRMRLDSSGNLGLGVTPSAWSTYLGLQIGSGSSIAGRNDGLPITLYSSNAYFDGTNYRYILNKPAVQYVQDGNGGTHWWSIASSGTAGNAITFTQAMTLDASGNLFIGATSGSNTAGFTNRLYLEGNVPGLTLSNTGTNTGKFTFGVTNGNLGIWNNATSSYPLFINSSNNVGIGTTSPGAKLHISAGYGLVNNAYSWAVYNQASSGFAAQFGAAGDVAFATNGDNAIITAAGSNAILFGTNSTERMRITSGGDVQVTKTTGTLLDIRATSTGGTAELKLNPVNNNNYSLYTSGSTDALQFLRNGSEQMRITSGGNVGIGVTPSAWTAFNPVLQIKTGSLGSSSTSNFRMFANTYYDGSYKYIGTGTATQYEQDGYHAWYTAPSGSANAVITFTERMRLDASGNLGLGVTPSAWSTFTAMQIKNASFAGQANFAYMGANYYYDGTNNRYIASDFASRYQQFNGIHQWLTASSGTAGNIITFTGAMTLDASGRLGIGTTSPSVALEVAGASNLSTRIRAAKTSSGTIEIGADRDTFGSPYISAITNSNLDFFTNDTHRMRITSGGLVGIGTTSPGGTLDVAGALSSSRSFIRITNTDTNNYVTIGAGVPGISNAGMNFTVDATTRMIISSSGSVGIGTTSPLYKLDVNGIASISTSNTSLNAQNSAFYFNNTYPSNYALASISYGTEGQFYYGYLAFNTITTGFANVLTERMRITQAGNVGIGISSPSQLLDVRSANTSGATGATIRIGSQNHGNSGDEFANLEFYWGDPDAAEVKAKIYTKNVGNVGPGGGGAADLLFATTPAFGSSTERMRITSGGYLKASNVGTYVGSTNSWHELRTNNAGEPIAIVSASSGSYAGVGLQVRVNRTSTGGNYLFLQAWDEAAAVARFRVLDSGNVENTNGSYGTISDISLKENIVDATPKLLDILNLKVKNFNLKADENKLKQIGFIAQEFEEVFPSMIDTDQKTGLKSIKTSVLIPVLVKAIQELKTELDTLKK